MAATAILGGGAAGGAVLTSEDPQATPKLCTNVPDRLFRDSVAAASIASGNPKIFLLLSVILYLRIFTKFDPVTIASASLAQVHVMHLHNGQKVAVNVYKQSSLPSVQFGSLKPGSLLYSDIFAYTYGLFNLQVQHSHMTDTVAADYATVEWLFPNFDYRWLVAEVRESLPKVSQDGERSDSDFLDVAIKELELLVEARNSEKCPRNFQKLLPHTDRIYVPLVYWNLSTSILLTVEFMDGMRVDDVKGIQNMGIRPYHVSKLVSEDFAEMIFKHGFVHCDPHAANLLGKEPFRHNSDLPCGSAGTRRPQLVLLDHGLYKELDFSTRINYAALWKDVYALFAGILTMRPWNGVIDTSVDHLLVRGTESDRSELRLQGSSMKTYLIIGKVSPEAVIEAKLQQGKSILGWIGVRWEEILLNARLLAMQVALWFLHLQEVLQYRRALGC
ncbi:LOW QUALITY PROTEIN: hypothetical protein Cgig2_032725 [Carnegiea gigantea]|uniref:ABC1 atypical kinase-like domain-containing protein n=1 Tax=Carnegiea gigantea TaxID=171969 RepID=A0A9Q1KJE3_9CARY|nr:LOW QUALITY PROTEIN: hypothetical protein Cgig2_032725 [Carnegiea gigantea]